MTEPDPRPTPVLDAARLGGLVGAAFVTCGGVYFLVTEGITRDNLGIVGPAVTAAVTALVALAVYASAVIHGRAAQARATPVQDPQDDAGDPLKTAAQWAATWGQHAATWDTPGRYAYGGTIAPAAAAPAPQPAAVGFPLEAWDAFTANPYSKPKMRAAVAAVNAWLNQ